MTATRCVHEFREFGPVAARILAIDVTDARIHASKPYVLARGGYFHDQVLIASMTKAELRELRDSLNRELGE